MYLLDTSRAIFRSSPLLDASTFNELAPLLEITTTLDPQLLPPYEFGASFLAPNPPNGAGEPDRAIELMQYGIQHNPDNCRLYYDLGFVYYTEFKDYKKASEDFCAGRGSQRASGHEGSGGVDERACRRFRDRPNVVDGTYESSGESNIRANAAQHLRSIKVDEDVTNLQAAVSQFGQRTGRLPTSLAELSSAMHFQEFQRIRMAILTS